MSYFVFRTGLDFFSALLYSAIRFSTEDVSSGSMFLACLRNEIILE